jgi:hypothetical protein
VPALLDHPVDHPDDPTGPVWIRLDRRPVQREQARSVWSRPDRRRAPGYGSGGWSSNPRGEQHRVQGCSSSLAGARLTPGTGRQPRLRGQRRQRRGGGGSDVTDERRPRPNPHPTNGPTRTRSSGARWTERPTCPCARTLSGDGSTRRWTCRIPGRPATTDRWPRDGTTATTSSRGTGRRSPSSGGRNGRASTSRSCSAGVAGAGRSSRC